MNCAITWIARKLFFIFTQKKIKHKSCISLNISIPPPGYVNQYITSPHTMYRASIQPHSDWFLFGFVFFIHVHPLILMFHIQDEPWGCCRAISPATHQWHQTFRNLVHRYCHTAIITREGQECPWSRMFPNGDCTCGLQSCHCTLTSAH